MGKLHQSLIIVLLLAFNAYAADPLAARIRTNTSAFDNNLSSADTDVQKALDTLDAMVGGGGGYATVQEEGSALTQRTKLNFIGSSVTCADDAGNTRTNCTFTDADTTYTAGGTLLQLGTTTFSVKEGTLTTGKGCKFVTGTGLVCDQDYLTSFTETDPNALLSAGTDNVKDTHIDWGTGAGQVSTDDMPEGSTNKYSTLTNIQSATTSDFHNIGGTDDDVPEAADYTNLTAGAGIAAPSTGTLATASDEADFLKSGALTCGASTQGKAQVHTTPLQYCDNAATPTLQYAAYGSSTGVATSASALAADPANCSAGSVAGGITATGAAESCLDPIVSTEIDTSSELAGILTDEDGTGTCGTGAFCIGGHTHPTTEISGVNAGTDLTADLEEESVAEVYDATGWDGDTGVAQKNDIRDKIETMGAGGAPTDADYLVGTANGSLSAEIAVGTSPGGELGGTWASPTIDDTGISLTSITIGALLGVDSIDATGAVDMDYGSADITDHTFTSDGGTVILDGSVVTDFFSSDNADPADAGVLRLGNAETIAWEASPAGTDVTLSVDASEVMQTSGALNVGGALTEGANAVYNSSETPGGELGGTWASPTIDDSVTVTGWVMGASTATTPSANDNDTSLATTAYVQTEINAMGGRSLTCASGSCDADVELYTDTKCITIESPIDADNFIFYRVPLAATITSIYGIVENATSAVITVQECDTAGDACAGIDGATTITADVDGQADDGSLSNAGVDAGDWIRLDVGTVTGTVGHLTACITYTNDD